MTVRQAGGVVILGNEVVLRRTARDEHLFPKGHVEPGETPEETALREVAEETGLEAKILAPLGDVSFTFLGEEYLVTFFLMRAVRKLPEWHDHDGRDAVAVLPERAATLLSFESYRMLWSRAEQILRSDPGAF